MAEWYTGIYGQDLAVRTLQGILATSDRGRFLLLHGPRGVGKATTAQALASYLLCKSAARPCGTCLACRDPFKHPDMAMLAPEKVGGSIKIEAVREASEPVFYPPLSGRNRVWLLDPIEDLTPGAANALLRLLEELPSWLWVIATAHNLSAVVVTLRSRAVKVPFGLLDAEALGRLIENDTAANAGTMQRARLLADRDLQKSVQNWRALLDGTWYDPDAAVKFARSAGGKGGDLQTFFVSLLLLYAQGKIALSSVSPYHGDPEDWPHSLWQAFLGERAMLQAAIGDLEANVNPSFVCEATARSIRRLRKQYAVI